MSASSEPEIRDLALVATEPNSNPRHPTEWTEPLHEEFTQRLPELQVVECSDSDPLEYAANFSR